MANVTRFTDPAAVDVWDAHFRWRVGDELRDRTIDATWQRTAAAIAAANKSERARWTQRYADAFSAWQLLPDERLLRAAGTGATMTRFDPLHATINAAAFILKPGTRHAHFDHDGFAATAALAVRLLDDALLVIDTSRAAPDLCIGMMGVSDALASLGTSYTDASARQHVCAMAQTLAAGCLQGSVALMRDRGALTSTSPQCATTWLARGVPPALVKDALVHGMRHGRLTALERQPRLAMLANNICDALDPPAFYPAPFSARAPNALVNVAQQADDALLAQIELRGAVQPWIDAPINYPILSREMPSSRTLAAYQRLARQRGLPPLSFREMPGLG